jgi:hypothetical protein
MATPMASDDLQESLWPARHVASVSPCYGARIESIWAPANETAGSFRSPPFGPTVAPDQVFMPGLLSRSARGIGKQVCDPTFT